MTRQMMIWHEREFNCWILKGLHEYDLLLFKSQMPHGTWSKIMDLWLGFYWKTMGFKEGAHEFYFLNSEKNSHAFKSPSLFSQTQAHGILGFSLKIETMRF